MTQSEFILKIVSFIERVNLDPDRFCGMLAPHFVECCAEAKSITLCFDTQAWEENPLGVIHGGIISGMLDSAMGILASTVSGGRSVTVSLQTSFLRATYAGEKINVRAVVTYAGRSIVHCEAKAYREGEPADPIATATAVFKPIAPI